MILGVPVFYFILPLYSFSKMDDFSWGTTRQVDESTTPDSMVSDIEVGASPHRGNGEGIRHQSPRQTVRTHANMKTHNDYGRNTTNSASTSDSRVGNQPPRQSIPAYLNLNTGDFNEDEMNEMLSSALDDAPVVPV